MAKPNTYVLLRAAQAEIARLRENLDIIKGFTVQQCQDMAMIALHEEFQFGPDREVRFQKKFEETFLRYARLCVEDSEDDPEIAYTQAVLDRVLREACGEENFAQWEERYDLKNLYFREKLKTGGTET